MGVFETVRAQLTVALVSGAVGVLVTILATKLLGKTAKFRYSTSVERVGTAADDDVFGNIRVSWRGNEVRNLYMASVAIENASNRDFENVDFKVYTNNDTFLLNERTSVAGTPDIVTWSEPFRVQMAVPADQPPTDAQWKVYNHSREYRVGVLNRGQVLT